MHTALVTVLGLALTLLGVWEVFMAVLHPRAVSGPVTSGIYYVFHLWLKSPISHKQRLSMYSGPVLIVVQMICWATMLLVGVSLIVWPQLGHGIVANGSKPTETGFVNAIYYAGFTITTLGVGDLIPVTPAMQILTITTAALGFSFFTLVLAYVLSVYSALARRNQIATEIDYRTQRSGDTLVYLKPYLLNDDPSLLHQDLYTLSSALAELLESHHFYQGLHYIRFNEARYSMTRMLRLCLETASLLRALRSIDAPVASANTEPADRLWHASMQMLESTMHHFVICRSSDLDPDLRLASRVSQLMHDAKQGAADQQARLEKAYAEQQLHWWNDLDALAICTGTKLKGDTS